MRKIILFIVSFFNAGVLLSQMNVESPAVKIMERSPAAPNTASLGKYFDVPVNLSTGVPNIQIPLYTIKSGNITVPITLSYNITGIKVNTPASWVGFGWDLGCGGLITKQINGLDDFYAKTQYVSGQLPAYSDYLNPLYDIDGNLGFTNMSDIIDTMENSAYAISHANELYKLMGRVVQSKYDGESDEYHYNTPGDNGTIFYNQKIQSFINNKLDATVVSYDNSNDAWGIKNKSGLVYGFTAKERTLSPAYNIPISPNQPQASEMYTSAWYLTSIDDNATGKSVNFSYDVSANKKYDNGTTKTRDYLMSSGIIFNGETPQILERYGNELNISQVSFAEGRIDFIKDAATRLDDGPKALKEIKIYDKDNVLKKQFNLTYFYANAQTPGAARLFLKSVQEVDFSMAMENTTRPYLIHYDTAIALPPKFSFAQDIWGYYNGKTGNTTIIPTEPETLAIGLPAFANRWVDANYTKAGSIKQIVYPTGGSLNFTFENNKVGDSLVGGLRIKTILNVDSLTGKQLQTNYNYNNDAGGSTGSMQYRPTFHYFLYKGTTPDYNCRVTGEPIYPLFGNQGSPVTYTRVEKIDVGDGAELKTRYSFIGPGSVDIPGSATFQNISGGVPRNKYPDFRQFSDLLYQTDIFKKQSGTFTLIQRNSTGYNSLNQFKKYIWNAQAAWANGAVNTLAEWWGNDPYAYTPMNIYPSVNAYKLFQESLVSDFSETKVYDGTNVLTQGITREFDQTNGNLIKSTTTASNGDILRSYITYAKNYLYTASGGTINTEIKTLVDASILSTPIEVINTTQKTGGAELVTAANLYCYKQGTVSKIMKINKPILLSAFTHAYNNTNGFYYDSNYETETEITSFNSDRNPEEIKDIKGNIQAMVWDGEYLLASITNANISDVAAVSFETAGKGRWSFSGSIVTDATSPTGKKAYNLGTGSISRSSLDNGKTYIVSYWSKNGAQTVNAAAPTITGRNVSGWTYYEHKITNPSSGVITITGSGSIDEVRLFPLLSMMKTYTYTTLVGVSSECDMTNRITYYEYDRYSRLSVIRDQDKNVVKKICYNYAGAPESCTFYYNTVKSGNFTRTNCGVNAIAGTVTYTVAAGTITSSVSQADADAQAIAKVSADGPAYANANATCTQVYYNVVKSGNFTRNNCGSGSLSAPVTYTVAANTYNSTISQAYVDAQAENDVNSNGQAYANANGVCSSVIYARLSYENQSGNTADIVVRFYSDEQGLSPLSVSSLTVDYREEAYDDIQSSTSYYPSSLPCSGYSTVLVSSALLFEPLNDPYGTNIYRTYSLLSDGITFIII